jgi:signal transduction histidine kinase
MNPKDDLKLAGLVHDLNNVFQTLVDSADLLSEDPRWTRISAAILRSVERGKNIAEGLRDGTGGGTPFAHILDNAIAFVEDSQIAGRGPAIRFICQAEPGIDLGGNYAWERVLINLFLNARRAMPQGGTIQVRARRLDPTNVEIVVADEGSGIAEEVREHLFEPHVSAHGSKGLGLHIVETIVKEHGGAIGAANRSDGRGAEFIIRVPVAARVPAAAPRAVEAGKSAGPTQGP